MCEHVFAVYNLPSGAGRLTCTACGATQWRSATWMQRWYRERLAVQQLVEAG